MLYVSNPLEADTRRGLKRSWPTTSSEKGKTTGILRYIYPGQHKNTTLHTQLCVMTILVFLGKSGRGSKAKNSSHTTGEASGSSSSGTGPGSSKFKIPKKPLLNPDPDSSAQGEENFRNKFSSNISSSINCYMNSKELLPNDMRDLCLSFEKLTMYSSAKSTWAKHQSAWNSFKNFSNIYGKETNFPVNIKIMRAYTTWALSTQKLKASTVQSYISSLKFAHQLGGLQCENFSADKNIILLLKGADNYNCLFNSTPPIRCAFNIHLLRIFGHRISLENWGPISKQVIWAAATTGFFTSCRMGEILPSHENFFDKKTTLLWRHVKFLNDNEILIHVPFSKTTGLKGIYLYVFLIPNEQCCPFKALLELRQFLVSGESYSVDRPVFSFASGKGLTTAKMNEIMGKLLFDFNDSKAKLSCHSFRAAIASAISASPDKGTVKELKEWGRWKGDSYKRYTKTERDNNRVLFGKIVKML